MTSPSLQARIRTFTFHGDAVPVLRDVELAALPGTLTTVLGGSGSGKTTLGKLLAGWLRGGHGGSLSGSLQLGPTRLVFRGGPDDPRINPAAWSRRVAYVPQDAAATLSSVRSTVAEELAFGLENLGMPRDDMHHEVARTAALTGLTALLGRDPATLSGGELRRLAVGCAAITGPEVLVLDEPLSSLDAAGAVRIQDLIRGLLDAGTAVVLLSQAADGFARTAACWIVLDGGTVTASGSPERLVVSPELARAGVVVPDMPSPGRRVRDMSTSTPGAAPVLELSGIGFGYGPARESSVDAPREDVLRDLALAVQQGEIVAVTGPNGAGKSTLLRHFNGLLHPAVGEVRVQGSSIAGIPTGRIAASVGLLFQHPRDQLFERTALREVAFGLHELPAQGHNSGQGKSHAPWPGGRTKRMARELAETRAHEALAAVGLADAAGTHPAELPASQQRLLALATVLAREPALLALDEPAIGLDRHGLDVLRAAIDAATARGAAVVLVTHDIAYARATAHRILELSGGRLRDA
jgi:energy-coupling factor transporter ATP-binding protein EcfA2